MASYLSTFDASSVLTAAVSGFVQAVLAGQLSMEGIENLQRKIRSFEVSSQKAQQRSERKPTLG